MDSKENRQGHNRLPFNIWSGGEPHIIRDDEELCEECGGRGGHSESKTGDGLIQMCPYCNGKGYKDWIEKARGVDTKLRYFIEHTGDKNASVIDQGEMDDFLKKIELRVTGQFKFIPKDEI